MSNLGLKFKDSSTASKKMLVEYYEITLNRFMCYDNIICPNLTHNKVGAYCHHLTKNIDPRWLALLWCKRIIHQINQEGKQMHLSGWPRQDPNFK